MPSDTYDAILWVARRLFIRQGYTATSMRQIAEEVGIGKATIYHHFVDKLLIVTVLFERHFVQPAGAAKDQSGNTDPQGQIKKAVQENLAFFQNTNDIIQVIRREVPELGPRLVTELENHNRIYSRYLKDAIDNGIKDGIFRKIEVDMAVNFLLTLVQGSSITPILLGENIYSGQNQMDVWLDIFFHGIEK